MLQNVKLPTLQSLELRFSENSSTLLNTCQDISIVPLDLKNFVAHKKTRLRLILHATRTCRMSLWNILQLMEYCV